MCYNPAADVLVTLKCGRNPNCFITDNHDGTGFIKIPELELEQTILLNDYGFLVAAIFNPSERHYGYIDVDCPCLLWLKYQDSVEVVGNIVKIYWRAVEGAGASTGYYHLITEYQVVSGEFKFLSACFELLPGHNYEAVLRDCKDKYNEYVLNN